MKVTKRLFLVNGCVMNMGGCTYRFSYVFEARDPCRARKIVLEIQLTLGAGVLKSSHEHYRANTFGVPQWSPESNAQGQPQKCKRCCWCPLGQWEEEVADPCTGRCGGTQQAALRSPSRARRDQNSTELKLVMLGKGDVPLTPSGLCHRAINGLSIFCCH